MIKLLKDRFDNGEDFDLKESSADAQSVASLMKLFLRELPESLFTEQLDLQFMVAGELPEVNDRVQHLAFLVSQLPVANYALLSTVMAHLKRVEALNSENKMTIRNLGIVFVPTLRIGATVFTLLITHHDSIFTVVPDF